MRLTSKSLGMIVLGFIFGGIAFSSWMGWWQTESSKEPVRFESGDAAGVYNPADIRGSYSFGDVSTLFDIPLEDLGAAFMLEDANVADVDLKELEERKISYGGGVLSVRRDLIASKVISVWPKIGEACVCPTVGFIDGHLRDFALGPYSCLLPVSEWPGRTRRETYASDAEWHGLVKGRLRTRNVAIEESELQKRVRRFGT